MSTALDPHDTLHEGEEAPPPGVRSMALIRWALILGLLGAAVYTAGRYYQWWGAAIAKEALYRCPMHPAVVSDKPGTCPICGMDLVAVDRADAAAKGEGAAAATDDARTPAWACPLHPDYGGDGPGECPVCGEPLVRSRRRAPTGLLPVTIDSTRAQMIGVRTVRVRRKSLVQHTGFAGVLTLDERGLARVQTRYAGWLESVAVTETGAMVRKGQILATLFSNDIYLAQTELVHALHAVETSPSKEMAEIQQSLVQAARKRLALLGLPKEELVQLEKTRKAERLVRVYAPRSGRVLVRGAIVGGFVQPGSELFTLGDLSRVWFLADVPEAQAVSIRRGQHAELRFTAYPTRLFSARATFIYPMADAAARTIKVRFELKNPKGLLRPGMFGRVDVASAPGDALVAPSEAVVDTGEQQYTFVAGKGGRFAPRLVKTGAVHGDDVEILEGLADGEEVVTSAGFLIDSESRLRAAAEGMGTAPAGPAGPGAEGAAKPPTAQAAPAKAEHSQHGGQP